MKSTVTRTVGADGQLLAHETETERYFLSTYRGPWRFMMMFSGEGLSELRERLADRTLGMQATRVLFEMVASVDVHEQNKVRAGRKDLARLLDMDEAAVSKAIKKLVECGFVEAPKMRFDHYTISPRFAWCGHTHELKRALAERGMLDEKGMIRPAAA